MTSADLGRKLGIAFLAASPALLGALAGGSVSPWNAVGAALVVAGLVAIRVTRGRWLSAPFVMLLLSTAGMALGLLIDRLWAGPDVLASLCGSVREPFSTSALRHWELLRATNIAMILGGLATIGLIEHRARLSPRTRCRRAVCARTGFNIACNAAMVLGMLMGAWLGPLAAAMLDFGWGISGMMAAMTAGMVWGMAGSMALARTGFAIIDRRAAWRGLAPNL